MGTAGNLGFELSDVDVFFHLDQPAKPILDGVLVDLERLFDDDAAFHLALDEIDFHVGTAFQRAFPDKHGPPLPAESIASTGPVLCLRKRQPVSGL